MALLAILNMVMTFGILAGVWWGVIKPNTSLAKVLNEIKKYVGRLIDDDTVTE